MDGKAGRKSIHDFYSREVQNPIHLTVETGFTMGEASAEAYISSNLCLRGRHLAKQFQEIPLRMIDALKDGCSVAAHCLCPLLTSSMEDGPGTVCPHVADRGSSHTDLQQQKCMKLQPTKNADRLNALKKEGMELDAQINEEKMTFFGKMKEAKALGERNQPLREDLQHKRFL